MHVADTFDFGRPPVSDGRLQLGVWQGIFLLEHRASPHRRDLVLTTRSKSTPGGAGDGVCARASMAQRNSEVASRIALNARTRPAKPSVNLPAE